MPTSQIVRREASLYDAVLIGFAAREQGLLVAAGNPLGLTGLARRPRAASCAWPCGPKAPAPSNCCWACSSATGLSIGDLGPHASWHRTGPDIAQAIRAGHADCGIATRAVASRGRLGFVPLCIERFDLLMRQRDYFRPPLQTPPRAY